jgi:nanoRNase/pAp phosphatase (c-di-AMP/oligoRNAs hydrolase)
LPEMTSFKEYVGSFGEEKRKVAIFTHPDPDPDAMGSCLGMKWLLCKLGIEADIFFDGDYSSRRQNTAMVNILNISMLPLSKYAEKRDEYISAITLDCTHRRLPEAVAKDIRVIVDHHSVQVDISQFDFVVNKKAGACCSLVYEIMEEMGHVPSADGDNGDATIATAMLLGIRSDSDTYRREDTSSLDYRASGALFPVVDMDVVEQVERCKLPRYHFELRSEIIKPGNFEIVNGSTFLGCVGYISQAKMASLPILADEIVHDMEGITTSIVFAMIDERRVVELRMRSDDVSLEVAKFLQKHFGDFAGAKYGSGGASIPLGIFGIPNPPAELRKNIFDVTKAVIMTALSRDVKSE